jgi:hypothetical protein
MFKALSVKRRTFNPELSTFNVQQVNLLNVGRSRLTETSNGLRTGVTRCFPDWHWTPLLWQLWQ